MTPTDVEIVQIELKKLKKLCEQMKIDINELDMALPIPVRPYIQTVAPQIKLDGVSLLY